jgi:hypothetical protein
MKNIRFIVALVALAPLIAVAFPIDLEMHSQGIDVEPTTSQMEKITVLQLMNHESFPVDCSVQFKNGPELARKRRVTIRAGGRSTIQYTAQRAVIRLKVMISCSASEEQE